MAAVCRLFASLVTVASDRTLCVHKLELWEYCSIDNFRRRYPSTYRLSLARLFVALSLIRTDSRLWLETGQ